MPVSCDMVHTNLFMAHKWECGYHFVHTSKYTQYYFETIVLMTYFLSLWSNLNRENQEWNHISWMKW